MVFDKPWSSNGIPKLKSPSKLGNLTKLVKLNRPSFFNWKAFSDSHRPQHRTKIIIIIIFFTTLEKTRFSSIGTAALCGAWHLRIDSCWNMWKIIKSVPYRFRTSDLELVGALHASHPTVCARVSQPQKKNYTNN